MNAVKQQSSGGNMSEVVRLENAGDKALKRGDAVEAVLSYIEAVEQVKKTTKVQLWAELGDGRRDPENVPVETLFRLQEKIKTAEVIPMPKKRG